jgi:hypothetical protein
MELTDPVRDAGLLPGPTSRAGATRRGSSRHALEDVDVLAVIRCVDEANYGAYGSRRWRRCCSAKAPYRPVPCVASGAGYSSWRSRTAENDTTAYSGDRRPRGRSCARDRRHRPGRSGRPPAGRGRYATRARRRPGPGRADRARCRPRAGGRALPAQAGAPRSPAGPPPPRSRRRPESRRRPGCRAGRHAWRRRPRRRAPGEFRASSRRVKAPGRKARPRFRQAIMATPAPRDAPAGWPGRPGSRCPYRSQVWPLPRVNARADRPPPHPARRGRHLSRHGRPSPQRPRLRRCTPLAPWPVKPTAPRH